MIKRNKSKIYAFIILGVFKDSWIQEFLDSRTVRFLISTALELEDFNILRLEKNPIDGISGPTLASGSWTKKVSIVGPSGFVDVLVRIESFINNSEHDYISI